ncbi:MJ0042-type zinc finger domain-containing protein [Hwanghaeella sp.]|uniref:MJ0042-type zinc finger domain-containing protein n=1 Tax=Hwanghaeella sp. TaxID=2605943 RepID=UPI003CCBF87D
MILVCPNCSSRFKVKAEALGDAGRTVRCAKCGNKWHAGQEDLIDPEDLKSLSAATKGGTQAPAKKAAAKKAAAQKPAPAAAEETAPPPDQPEDDFPEPDTDASGAPDDDDLGAPPPPPPMMDGPEPPPIPSEADFAPRSTVPMRRKSPLIAWIVLFVIVIAIGAAGYSFQKQIVHLYPPAMKIYHALGIQVDLLGHGLELPEPEAEAVIDGDKRRLVIKGSLTNTTDETIVIPMLGGVLKDATGGVLHEWVFEADKPEAFPGETISYESAVEDPPRGATSLEVTFKTAEEAKMFMDGSHGMKADDGQGGAESQSTSGNQ